MCGIAGVWRARGADDPRAVVDAMLRRIRHRGPDGEGVWAQPAAGVVLGHRRLAILDLTAAATQPMVSASGRYVVTYNGELYNFQDLRLALGERPWRSASDTEVLVEAIDAWGIEEAVARFNGMYGFAVWDSLERQLHLARDGAGIKPLYYSSGGDGVAFASELPALMLGAGTQTEQDAAALADFFSWGYIRAPRTIWKGCRSLLPGTIATWSSPALPPRLRASGSPRRWGLSDRFSGEVSDAQPMADRLHEHLRSAIRRQMVSDVPIGAFLSGGTDSSLVTAIMQEAADRPVHTFSIGFEVAEYDESRQAQDVASHLGTRHHHRTVRGVDAAGIVSEMPRLYGEPFADASQLPTLLLAQFARQHVTVALSGDGGDELFAGYERYRSALRWGARLRRMPGWLRRATAVACRAGAAALIKFPFGALAQRDTASRLGRLGRCLRHADDAVALYEQLNRLQATHLPLGDWPGVTTDSDVRCAGGGTAASSALRLMMAADYATYMPDDVLVKVDRSTMAWGLEARVPLLDAEVVEWSHLVPDAMLIRGDQGKYILKEVLRRYLPPRMIDRPKRGFGVPLSDWLRGDLRPWAESLLTGSQLEDCAYFDRGGIRDLWYRHLRGWQGGTEVLWRVLMFEAWRLWQSRVPCQTHSPPMTRVSRRG